MTVDPAPPERRSTTIRNFVPVTLFGPLVGAALGIDGGPIFQILAIENLQLSPTTIGIAFGFGVVSLPVQLFAARTPLYRARRNTQLFLLIAAAQAWILAALVAAGTTGPFAATALAVTVTAEIALSVLYATAWQPLLSWSLNTKQRQRLNTTWPALARGLLAGFLVLFAALNSAGRAAFLIVTGATAVMCALGLQRVTDPPRRAARTADALELAADAPTRPLSRNTRLILVVFAAVNTGAVPLWLVYLNRVLWPSANLGLVAGIQTAASMIVLLAWRSTDGDVTRRARVASVMLLAAAVTIAAVSAPATTPVARMVVLAATATIAGAGTVVRVAMLEAAHRTVTEANSVRAFTILDVVASTSLQVGLFVGGFLIAASSTNTWPIDPYLGFVVAGSIATVAATRLSASARAA